MYKTVINNSYRDIVQFTEEEEAEAIKQYNEDTAKYQKEHPNAKQRFYTGKGWSGKIGETGYKLLHPTFEAVCSKYIVDDFDFIHPHTGEYTELKTRSGKWSFQPHFTVGCDVDQFNLKPYQLIVFGYYDTTIHTFCCVGWNEKEILRATAKYYPSGESKRKADGEILFTASGKSGWYDWKLEDLNSMFSIYQRKPLFA